MAAKVTIVEQVRFKKSKDVAREKKLLAELSYHRWLQNKILAEYKSAQKSSAKVQKKASYIAAHSFSVKFISAIIQNKRLPFARRATLVELEQIAHDLKLEKLCGEPVTLRVKIKPNGDFRPICDFGYAHRTAQTTGRRMLEPSTILRPWQYDFRGPGPAIELVRDAILGGLTFVSHVDVQNFNGSFELEMLREELPVPEKMVDHYLVGRYLKFAPQGCSYVPVGALLSKARSGVSHGASSSPIIGARTVSKINWYPAEGIVPAGYVDDLLLAGASNDVVAADAKTVCAAIAALPTGNFKAVIKWMGNASEGFDYLGVHMRLGKKLEIHPIEVRLVEFKTKLTMLCDKASVPVAVFATSQNEGHRPAALQAICEAYEYAQSWLGAYRVCDDIEALGVMAFSPVQALLSEIGCKVEHLKHYSSEGSKDGYPG